MNENFKMIGQGGWDVYVTGANGFVGKDGVVKGGLFDAQTGNPWCHKDCSRFHPTEVLKMVSKMSVSKNQIMVRSKQCKMDKRTLYLPPQKSNTLLPFARKTIH